MTTISSSQPNGIPSSSAPTTSQSTQPTQTTSTTMAASQPAAAAITSTASNTFPSQSQSQQQPQASSAPRPRDARTIELLLTSQGVTSFDSRVPLLLMDFAYRHTSSILNDALHLTTDPYTSAAGSKPSGTSGQAPSAPSAGDAQVSANAISLAISSRQSYQFRGGGGAGGTGGGGASKDWLLQLAHERNKVALPRVMANEWGVRLPNERFVLSGMGWGVRGDAWAEDGDENEEADADEDMDDAMAGMEGPGAAKKEDAEGEKANEPDLGDMLGDDIEEGDEDMEGME